MLKYSIKRTFIEGRNKFKVLLFNYKNGNFVDNVWKWINESQGERYIPISTPNITSTNVLFFKGKHSLNQTKVICKIPLDYNAQVRVERNFYNMISLYSNQSIPLALIPTPLCIIESPFGKIYIESLIKGIDGHEAIRKNQLSGIYAIEQGIEVVNDLQSRFPQCSLVFNDETVSNFINELMLIFSKCRIEKNQHKNVIQLLKKIQDKEIALGFSHGDYWLGNILFEQNELIGIIDWDYFTRDQPILYDRMHLDLFYHAIRNGCSIGEEIISRYNRKKSEDLIIYWIYFLKNALNNNPNIFKDKRWLEKNYFKVIRNLA